MSDQAWLKRAKQEKQKRDKLWDCEYCHKKRLREKILPEINSAQIKLERETYYTIEIRPNLSSIEVLVRDLTRKIEKLLDLHFKLKACENGIFLMYGASTKAQPASANGQVLYSKPELIHATVCKDMIIKWVGRALDLSLPLLELTERETELAMKQSANFSKKRPASLCCFLRRFLRSLRLI